MEIYIDIVHLSIYCTNSKFVSCPTDMYSSIIISSSTGFYLGLDIIFSYPVSSAFFNRRYFYRLPQTFFISYDINIFWRINPPPFLFLRILFIWYWSGISLLLDWGYTFSAIILYRWYCVLPKIYLETHDIYLSLEGNVNFDCLIKVLPLHKKHWIITALFRLCTK